MTRATLDENGATVRPPARLHQRLAKLFTQPATELGAHQAGVAGFVHNAFHDPILAVPRRVDAVASGVGSGAVLQVRVNGVSNESISVEREVAHLTKRLSRRQGETKERRWRAALARLPSVGPSSEFVGYDGRDKR